MLAAGTMAAGGAWAEPAEATRYVRTAGQFHAAVADFRTSGGTIVLLPGTYASTLVVGRRSSPRLWIEGREGTRVHAFRLDHTQAVTVRHLVVRPAGRDGGILAARSRAIVIAGVRFTGVRTGHRVALDLDHSVDVTVRASSFAHCGDRGPSSAICVYPRWAAHVTLRGNRFHDCYGCDSIHGRAGRNLVIERNRFGRVPRCDGPPMKCNHQDTIELFLGNGVVIRRNVFRETGYGRGQIFLSQSTHRVRIVNNVFLGGNLRVPGVTPPRGIVVGSMVSRDLPQYVRIANNTILTGGRDDDEFASVVISGFYLDAAPRIRPVLANNVIARLRHTLVCPRLLRSVRNVAAVGERCSDDDRIGDPMLTAEGRPTAGSTLLIDRASVVYAPPTDADGRGRVGPPDIGAYEHAP